MKAHSFGLLTAAVLTFSIAATGCGADSGQEATGQSGNATSGGNKTIKVASSLALAPYEFVDSGGTPTGYEVDVVESVLGKLGYKVNWVKTPFSQLFTGLQSKRYEMGASGVYMRCERVKNTAEYGEFSLPIGLAGQAVTVRKKENKSIVSWEDLKGLKLGVESAGSTADKVADVHKEIGFNKQIYPDTNALFLALQQGRIDVAMQSEDVTRYNIKNTPALQIAWIAPDTQQPFGWIFASGNEQVKKVNDEINTQRKAGTLAKIYEKWVGEAPAKNHPASADANVEPITATNCKD
jgi:polar amino acid transport system substrate-binding protein